MKMRTRNPAASTDIGSVIQSETARQRYIAVQVATNPPNDVAGCPRLRANIGPWNLLVPESIWSTPHPPPAEMNPPANRLAHRHRSAAAGAEITLVVGRRGEFARSKITVNYLVIGVVRHATADCTLRTDDLLAFARNQHVTGPCCMRLPRTIKPSAPPFATTAGRTRFGWRRTARESRKQAGSGRVSAPDVGGGRLRRLTRRCGGRVRAPDVTRGRLPRQLCFQVGRVVARRKSRQRDRAMRTSRQLLDVAQIGPLLVAAERDSGPGGAGPRGSADTMHVIFGHVRQFEIDDVRHPIDIDAASGNVGGDKHPGLAVTKAGERSF